ncbi:hypothetical protein RsoM2USA_170 [Ralstonia phage RsoM2USA]|nr:hypothetical protein RsoM2USA_170 [Ralstonia phage RsoM2USA]
MMNFALGICGIIVVLLAVFGLVQFLAMMGLVSMFNNGGHGSRFWNVVLMLSGLLTLVFGGFLIVKIWNWMPSISFVFH